MRVAPPLLAVKQRRSHRQECLCYPAGWQTPAFGSLRSSRHLHIALSENADIEKHVCASLPFIWLPALR
jgi:hypothetical protein